MTDAVGRRLWELEQRARAAAWRLFASGRMRESWRMLLRWGTWARGQLGRPGGGPRRPG
jgi:hypothetical protein